jgi:hypothetical protein
MLALICTRWKRNHSDTWTARSRRQWRRTARSREKNVQNSARDLAGSQRGTRHAVHGYAQCIRYNPLLQLFHRRLVERR